MLSSFTSSTAQPTPFARRLSSVHQFTLSLEQLESEEINFIILDDFVMNIKLHKNIVKTSIRKHDIKNATITTFECPIQAQQAILQSYENCISITDNSILGLTGISPVKNLIDRNINPPVIMISSDHIEGQTSLLDIESLPKPVKLRTMDRALNRIDSFSKRSASNQIILM